MTLEELAPKLGELDEIRRHAERELAALKGHQERITELEADRDTLLDYVESVIPERLDNLTGEQRNKVYRMLRLEVKPTAYGFEITGAILHKGTDALWRMAGLTGLPLWWSFHRAWSRRPRYAISAASEPTTVTARWRRSPNAVPRRSLAPTPG